MDIRRIPLSNTNEIIEVEVVHADYKGQVAKRINEKMPLATVKGFRKGQVPRELVEKQYGLSIKKEEVKKVAALALERFLANERINMLGTPLEIEKEIFNWEMENIIFQYEIGIVPHFDLDLEAKAGLIKYNIKADDTLIEEQIERIQKRYGKKEDQEIVSEGCDLTGTFYSDANNIENKATLPLTTFKDAQTQALFISKKIGDVVSLQTKGLFKDDHQLKEYLNIDHDNVHDLDITVDFTIENISSSIPAELNQELFNQLFGEGEVASLEELKEKIKADSEVQFAEQSENKLLDDVVNFVVSNHNFDLPKEFLVKWMQTSGEKKLSATEAEAEYNRSEKGLRFQLIEGKAMAQSNIQVNFEELKGFTQNLIRQQMAQYGQLNPSDQEIEGIIARVLSNQDEVKRITQQVASDKLLNQIKEKLNPTVKEVTYPEFIAVLYGE